MAEQLHNQLRVQRQQQLSTEPDLRAFTLIEMLVVIVITSLLVGILLPSLGRARAVTERVACASNLRQLQIANTSYAMDFEGRYLPGARNILENLERWHGTRPNASTPFAPQGAPILAYLGDNDGTSIASRSCPTLRRTLKVNEFGGDGGQSAFERSAGGYGYNNAFVGTLRRSLGPRRNNIWCVATDESGAFEHMFKQPSTTVAFSDTAFPGSKTAGGLIEYSFVEPRFQPDLGIRHRADPSMHFRHAEQANISYLDGHVEPSKMTFTWSSGLYTKTYESKMLGWHGVSDSNSGFGYR